MVWAEINKQPVYLVKICDEFPIDINWKHWTETALIEFREYAAALQHNM